MSAKRFLTGYPAWLGSVEEKYKNKLCTPLPPRVRE